MAGVIPDLASTGQRPTPQPSGGVASYEPPNWRQVGMAGQIVSGAGQELEGAANILAQTNERQDAIVANAAANRLNTARLALELDPKTGFLNVRGSAAVGQNFLDDYQGKLDTTKALIGEGLTNPLQKRLYEQHAEVVGLQYKSALLQHQAKETLQFNDQTRNDQVALGLSDIAAHPYDDSTNADGSTYSSTYNTQIVLMGRAVRSAAADMGLRDDENGPALSNFVRVGLQKLESKALGARVSGILIGTAGKPGNAIEAADLFHKHELDFDPNDRLHLAGMLRTATDAQTTRVLGQQAYTQAIGASAAPALPANFAADRVAPFNGKYIENLAELIAKPSPYDALFQKWGTAYNVSPAELKMRAAVESSLNANTGNSSQGAIGLMQFMPETAAALKIDPKDPEQAIIGAALLMSRAGGTVGGDMSKVDRTYYSGSADGKGPNTDQYVENLRALRQRVMGAAQPILTQAFLEGREGAVMDNARALAQTQRPGDLVYQDQAVAEARKNWSLSLAAIRGTNEKTVSDISALFASATPPKALSDLPADLQAAYGQLPGNTQAAIHARMVSGDKKFDEQSASIYYQLLGEAGSDPEAFVKNNLMDYFGLIPDDKWQGLAAMQKSINAKDVAQEAKSLNWTRARSTVEDMLKPINLGTTAKTGGKNAKDTEQFYGRLQEAMESYHDEQGKWPDSVNIRKMASSLLVQGAQAGTGWFFDNKVRAYQSEDQGKFYVPLPGAKTPEYAQLASSFQAVMKRAPTANELQQWYTKYRLAGGK